MRIGFEAKRIFSNFTGLGNYGRFIISALSEHFPDNQYFLYTPKLVSHPEIDPILAKSNVEVVEPSGLFKKFSSLWRSGGMSMNDTTKQLDIFHGLSQELPFGLPSHVKKVVTVHDLIFIRFPEFYHSWDVSIYKAKVSRACRQADAIVAISEQTKHDLIEFLKVEPEKIHVIYQGCHPNFKRPVSAEEIESVRRKYDLPPRYILNVGTIEERKNLLLILKALTSLPESERLPLVVVGRQTEYFQKIVEAVKSFKLESQVHFLHNAAFTDFPAIYKGASVFVYPSVFEGFGIPLVEAIESGIPVITSQGSCFSEAAGPSSVYIDPKNSDSLAQALSDMLRDSEKRSKNVKASREYIKKFEPSAVSRHLSSLYQKL